MLILSLAAKISTSASTAQATSSQLAVPFHLEEATVQSIHTAMLAGQLTCRGLVSGYLARIAAYDHSGPNFNSIQTVNPLAMQEAAALDAKFLETGKLSGPLHCYPPFDHTPAKLPRSTAGSNRVMATFLGWPAIELPAGFDSEGLPLGVEIMGRPYSEGLLIKAGFDYEQSTMHRRPPATAPLPR
jgi:Asp-tRNA(Asn)/Glu-tRNA(Gln) amidotransferase A subunit family amidase